MVFNGTGLVADDFYVTGFAWSPVYLLAKDPPVVFEAGFYCMGRLYEQDIRRVLSAKDPVLLFLTHVHYDHCGATAYLRKIFPGLKVAASKRAAEIIGRPHARQLMVSLSDYVIPLIARSPGIEKDMLIHDHFEPFDIDVILDEGDVLKLSDGLTVQVFATPGHTRDMLSYYIPERKILIATESAGCLGQTGHIVSEFLVDFDGYIHTMKRLSELDVEIFCQGHHFVFTGHDVNDFFKRSLRATEEFRENVEDLLKKEGGSIERVVEIIKALEYDPNPGPKQPERAYLLNLETRVKHLAGRLSRESVKPEVASRKS